VGRVGDPDPPLMHPLNGALRFVLELVMFGSLGWWGRSLADGAVGWFSGVAIALAAAALWGVFNVPGDPSRSGKAPVVVPGWLRLVVELGLFAASVAALGVVGSPAVAAAFGLLVVAHYLWYRSRLTWLLGR
jgi:hypothetical protein